MNALSCAPVPQLVQTALLLLVAVVFDGNSNVVPVDWIVATRGSKRLGSWFLKNLIAAYPRRPIPNFPLFSDRHKRPDTCSSNNAPFAQPLPVRLV